MRDDSGVVQMYLLSPNGGEPRQLTHGQEDIQSAFNWHPHGQMLGFVQNNQIVLVDANNGAITPLTQPGSDAPSADAVVFSPDGKHIAWMQNVDGFRQLLMTETGL